MKTEEKKMDWFFLPLSPWPICGICAPNEALVGWISCSQWAHALARGHCKASTDLEAETHSWPLGGSHVSGLSSGNELCNCTDSSD